MMVALAMKVVGAVAAAFLVKWAASSFDLRAGEDISSMALRQGGIGLVMTTLIISVPPMAAAFFQRTLGQFSGYSVMGALDRGASPAGANGTFIPNRTPVDSEVSRSDPGAAYQQKVIRADDAHSGESDGTRGLASR